MDKQEFKEYVLRNHLIIDKGYIGELCYKSNSYITMNEQEFRDLIDQLDEPKLDLSGKEWLFGNILKHSVLTKHQPDKTVLEIHLEKLDDLFEHLKEPEKVEEIVMPKEFDEWYRSIRSYYPSESSYKSLAIANINKIGHGYGFENEHRERVETGPVGGCEDLRCYVFQNKELCTRAILNGYTVEEKKYYVKDKKGGVLLFKNEEGVVLKTNGFESGYEVYRLTEQEIKDYDPRYMAFAEEVD